MLSVYSGSRDFFFYLLTKQIVDVSYIVIFSVDIIILFV